MVLKRGFCSKSLIEESVRWPNSYLKSQIKVNDVMICEQHMEPFRLILYLPVLPLLPKIFEFK